MTLGCIVTPTDCSSSAARCRAIDVLDIGVFVVVVGTAAVGREMNTKHQVFVARAACSTALQRRWLTASTLGLALDRARPPRSPPPLPPPPPFEGGAPSGLEKCLINARVTIKVNPEKEVFDPHIADDADADADAAFSCWEDMAARFAC